MAGMPVTRAIHETLDRLGEEEVFAVYLETRGVRNTLARISEETGHEMRASTQAFYRWLKQAEGRWDRWQEVKAMRGDMAVDEMEELAEDTDEDNVQVQRVRIEVKRWIAERLNAKEYGRQGQGGVTINAQNVWLGALKQAEQIPEAEYSVVGQEKVRGALAHTEVNEARAGGIEHASGLHNDTDSGDA